VDRTYDYVIVGAGSAGCTLAYRLGEQRGVRVLVLEAGGWDSDPLIHIPIAWAKLVEWQKYDWHYESEPEAQLNNRRIECARGKVIGGSSSINVTGYVRGHRGDYDRWAASGLSAWSYAKVLPYFRRQESWEGGASAYRGGDGPLTTISSRYRDPLGEAFAEAGQLAGHPATDDYNGAQQHGFGRGQSTIRNGRRCSAAVAYLHPAMVRGNVTVEVRALATRIVFDGKRTAGIEYEKGGEKHVARASREVILAGGVINSPQILMLSGIGAPEELARHGIEVKVPLRGVGKNLQDHLSVGIEYRRRDRSPFISMMRADRMAIGMAQAYLFGSGFATRLPGGHQAFLKSPLAGAIPDIQFLFRMVPLGAGPYLPPFKPAYPDGFGCRAVLLRPESRGRLSLRSADPHARPVLHQNFLATDRDWKTIRAGLRLVRDVFAQKPLQPFIEAELAPGPGRNSDADFDEHIRRAAATAHHPLGTCRMGPDSDETAVVDAELRVRGVEGLRVADASVMPDLVGGNINAPVIMIAEKAADMIRGLPPLAAANV
jgi:choline dehydrogenase/4-pyridoxate dehydrogenase